jgi:hypothetical protein
MTSFVIGSRRVVALREVPDQGGEHPGRVAGTAGVIRLPIARSASVLGWVELNPSPMRTAKRGENDRAGSGSER